jgi:hypothetical protein
LPKGKGFIALTILLSFGQTRRDIGVIQYPRVSDKWLDFLSGLADIQNSYKYSGNRMIFAKGHEKKSFTSTPKQVVYFVRRDRNPGKGSGVLVSSLLCTPVFYQQPLHSRKLFFVIGHQNHSGCPCVSGNHHIVRAYLPANPIQL